MAGPSWLVDSKRIATKIKSASGGCDPRKVNWKSDPTRSCPNCLHIIDNSEVTQEWPGLPRGVKFDPSDQEIIWHLLAKAGVGNLKSHPFIDEFIPTVDQDDGICYTHPQNLPGVKQDGSVSHFFHRAIKAYSTGTRKRRKIHGDNSGDVRWHKTGRTKPVNLDGVQKGCKKIMVLYVSPVRGGKSEKTNWVMHQYHLGVEEDEKEGEYVISKVFYQQQQVKQSDRTEPDFPESVDTPVAKFDPVTPKSVPELPRIERHSSDFDPGQGSTVTCMDPFALYQGMEYVEDDLQEGPCEESAMHEDHTADENENRIGEDAKWWEGESQYLLDSQQLVEGLSLCDEFLQSQSPNRDDVQENDGKSKGKPSLSDYARLGGAKDLKKDLMECQDLVLDPANVELGTHLKTNLVECQDLVLDPADLELDTPPDFRLSQLEFGSQESFLAWGGSKVVD